MKPEISIDNREILRQLLLQKASESTFEYSLAYGQQALWYLFKEAPDSIAYNLAFPLKIKSKLDIKALRRSFQKLVNRHHSLRTTFSDRDGEPVQTVHGYQQVYFKELDVADLSEEQLYDTALKTHRQPFDLEKGPLFRVHLFCKEDHDILLICAHHIISDFHTLLLMNEELWELYKGEVSGDNTLSSLGEIQYIDFVNKQKKTVESTMNEEHWAFWKDKLQGELSTLSLPIDKPRPPVQTYNGSSIPFTINKEMTKALKKCAVEEGVTLFVMLQAVLQLFLHRYSGQDDIIVGIPVSGRSQPNFDQIVGYLVNMVAIRVQFHDDKSFKELLQEVRTTITDALKHQDYPFVLLVDKLRLKRDPSRSPVFQVTFEYLNFNGNQRHASKGVSFEAYPLPQQEGQFDMILTLEDTGDYLHGKFNYNTDLFHEETIQKMSKHFNVLLEGIVADINMPISDLPLLSDEEKYEQLTLYNQTQVDHPYNKCIHELFEEKVKQIPSEIAISCEGKSISYDELNKKANQLARRLRIDGVGKDYIVGIMANRSIECIIGMLAVLKAGGAYLPIDPKYPDERLKLILEDSGTDILLTQREIKSVDYFKGVKIYLEDSIDYEHNEDNLNLINHPNDLAYIIYTSGSTGKPKGAMIEHKGVVNYISWAINHYGDENKTGLTFPFYSSISFDLTVTSIFTPLLSGNTIEVYGDDDFCLDKILLEDKVDIIKLTPSHLKALINEGISAKRLKAFIVGGEEFERKVAEEIDKKFSHKVIQYNEYGPTETVVGCMIYAYDKEKDKDKAVPIGVPSDNVKLYIFDQNKRLVPDCVIGELYIGGEGVCRGYLNRESLTTEKFIENPYVNGERIYKTGDLVRKRRDGIIEFIGRVDQQVKINGYRIECGEIEEYVMKTNTIKEAVVVIKEDQNSEKYLCCYYVSSRELLAEEIRKELSEKMPCYMIPTKFIQLDQMPLNQNGKIDRKSLQNKSIEVETSELYKAPRNQLEKDLSEIWAGVLKTKEEIGIHDNFFNLGGNSLLAIQAIQRLRKMGLGCKTSDLLQHPTIEELAKHIQKSNAIQNSTAGTDSKAEKESKEEKDTKEEKDAKEEKDYTGDIGLTPAQTWFFDHFKDFSHFNQYVLLKTNRLIHINHLEKALNAVINHHDQLRAYYTKKDSKWIQTIEEKKEYRMLTIHDLSGVETSLQDEKVAEIISEKQMELYISQTPLIKGSYFIQDDYKGTLAIYMHHLITDFVSFGIIIEDLNLYYELLETGKDLYLPSKTTSFRAWSNALETYARANDFEADIQYWNLEAMKDIPLIPFDYSDSILSNTEESRVDSILSLNRNESEKILKSIPLEYAVNGHEFILTCISEALYKWTGHNRLLIDFEGHGREEIDPSIDLTRTVGWFTSMYPLQITLDEKSEGPLRRINEVKNQIKKVPNNGFHYGILKYIKKHEGFDKLPIPQIGYNYLGDLDHQTGDRTFEVDNLHLSSGKLNQLPYILHFNIVIVEGQLHIMLTYSKNLFKQETIQAFIEIIQEEFTCKINALWDKATKDITTCKKCILPNTFPKIEISEEGTCNYCKDYHSVIIDDSKDFADEEELLRSLEKYKKLGNKYDVLVPLSGGVDSSVALIEIVKKYKLKALGFHNDHGYEDETATNNVKKLCKALEVDLIIKQHDTPFMKKLWKHTNQSKVKGLSSCFVCGGILYANAVEIADRYDIPLIINGYSKGQATMMANKETALEFWEEMIEEFQEDEAFFDEFMERQKPMSKQKVYLAREDLDTPVDKNKILVIPFYIFKFNKTDKVILRKKCEEMFDWRQMKTSYPGRTTNCDMVWLNTYMDLQRMQHTMYHEEYASLVRKGEITRTQALADLEFNPPEGVVERLAKDIDLNLNIKK
ncbi:MAG: hypothetical protein CVU84_01400 [Firmicutes bacterium HGW-Firmicutes-1]|jgi:amino acid adenylation domain-containing protein/non-ribosomal peptide synthase protein (TIGR01720 family)|nr:MAG: hypothetical protein CVU84_01400 [Firmicutes bacterium HGW-Firmicutes-1]